MFLLCKLLLLLLACNATAIVSSALYTVRYVEEDCRNGNETIIYALDGYGPPYSVGVLRAVRDRTYSAAQNCTIIVKAPQGHNVVVALKKIDFIAGSCPQDYLKIFTSHLLRPKTVCHFKFDLQEKQSFSSYEKLTIQYHTGPRNPGVYYEIGFEIVITELSADCAGPERFQCNNGWCTWRSLTCDGHNNCGDNSDESSILCNKFPLIDLSEKYIVIISICTLMFLFILSCTVFCCVRNKRSLARSVQSSEEDLSPPLPSPYQAVHPSGHFFSHNPAGPNVTYPPQYASIVTPEGGFSNPCYPSGFPTPSPPPPYKP